MEMDALRDAVIGSVQLASGVSSVTIDAVDPAKIVICLDSVTLTANLTNLLNRIRAYPEESSAKLITEFVTMLEDVRSKRGSKRVNEENLVATLRTQAYVEQISRRKAGALAEPFVGDLMIVYMLDMPSSMSAVSQEDFPSKHLGEIRDIALKNARKWLCSVKSDSRLGIGTLYYVEGNTMLSPTLVLLDEFWGSIAARYSGDALIAVPRRDQLFIIDDDADGRKLAHRLIDATFKDDFELLSELIFARRNGKIVALDGEN